jgi:hypothetical protein
MEIIKSAVMKQFEINRKPNQDPYCLRMLRFSTYLTNTIYYVQCMKKVIIPVLFFCGSMRWYTESACVFQNIKMIAEVH